MVIESLQTHRLMLGNLQTPAFRQQLYCRDLITTTPIRSFLKFGKGNVTNEQRKILVASILPEEPLSSGEKAALTKTLGISTRLLNEAEKCKAQVLSGEGMQAHVRKGQIAQCTMRYE